MDSFFFNITDTRYKITKLYKKDSNFINRIDISNGLVFFDIYLENIAQQFTIKNLDRMIMIPVVSNGELSIYNNSTSKNTICLENTMDLFCSSRQDFTFKIKQNKLSKIFILFISDFYLKRYLSSNSTEPIDFLYKNIQGENYLDLVNSVSIDALSLYIINKITTLNTNSNMQSIIKEHNVIEYLIHRFSLLDFYDSSFSNEQLDIAKKAKNHLLENFISPPTIKELAHLCATNESKLKKIFKKVYKNTIYGYVQELKLKEANLLLKEQILNIGQIAKTIGYKHQGHFSKLFFKKYGVYPKDLLKK